jgi:hypothetical protein
MLKQPDTISESLNMKIIAPLVAFGLPVDCGYIVITPSAASVLLGECRCHLEHGIVEESPLGNDHIHGLHRIANGLEAVLDHLCFVVMDRLEQRLLPIASRN